MKKIPVFAKDAEITDIVKRTCEEFADEFQAFFFTEQNELVSFLNYEIPELKIFDFSDPDLPCTEVLEVIRSDSWLHLGGIISIAENVETKLLMEEKQDIHTLMVLTKSEFGRYFPHLMRIFRQNSNFLFNRGMQQYVLKHEIGMFKCDNDPIGISLYANLLSDYLYNTNRLDARGRYHLKTVLVELLLNALEHGNCGISYQEKHEYLEKGGDILDLIADKNRDPLISARKIYFAYEILPEKTRVSITDEGNGFDWRSRLGKKSVAGLHGMGINMTESFVHKMVYNEKGNQVLFEILNQQAETNDIPSILKNSQVLKYQEKEIVCRENEETNDLFFILSGFFEVYSNGKLISILTPNDLFIGEMAFLLNDRRSATIVAGRNSRLIRIHKSDFTTLIRQNPHYGLFLSKLLAQRLQRQTQKTVKISAELAALKKERIETVSATDGQQPDPSGA